MYSVLAAYKKCPNATRPGKYSDLISIFNWSGISFPTKLSEIPIFEKKNNLTINVFGLFKYSKSTRYLPYPVYISENFSSKNCFHINLLLYESHYILIRNLDTFIRPFYYKTTRYYCKKCLLSFSRKVSYDLHERADCTSNVYSGQSYILPPGGKIKFQNLSKQIKNHFIIYADFETLNVRVDKLKGKSTELKTRHTLNAVGAILVSKYSEYSRPPFIYTGPNVIKNFLGFIYQARAEITHIFENERKPLDVTTRDVLHLSTQSKCYLCGIRFKKSGVRKVIDHAHLGREGKGRDVNYACNTCNLTHSALIFSKFKIPIVMHNAMNYDLHFIVKNIYKYIEAVNLEVIPRSSEKFLSMFLDNFVFIDSFQFLPNSLSNLAELLEKKNVKDFKETKKYFPDKKLFPYVVRKGVMCYDYLDSWEKLEEKELPPRDAFYNSLTNKHISEEDYQHALDMFKVFMCKSIKDYLKEYLKIDVLLLTDVFESFREKSLDYYGLDPAKYLTAPSLSYDAMLKFTKVELELITELDMYNFFEKGIRGGMTNVVQRHAEVKEDNEHIVYYDCNNLYGFAMIQALPLKHFAWVSPEDYQSFDINKIADDSKVGYILEVTLEYPSHLHDLHNMFPLAPEKLSIVLSQLSPYARSILTAMNINYKKSACKLISTLSKKEKYIIHYRVLKLYLKLGLVIKEIHRIVSFTQSSWMKPYIDFNNQKRKEASSDFDKEFFKLMNNSTFGKCMENVKRRVKMVLTSSQDRCTSIINKPTFQSLHVFNPNFVGIQYRKPIVELNKPIYLGFSILDLSKMHMFDFHYNVVLKTFGFEAVQLLYTDTDSLVYFITHTRFADLLYKIRRYFDFSNLDKSNVLYTENNKKVLGKFKDETGGKTIKEFIGLRPKMYSILLSSGKNIKRVKGIKRHSVDKLLHSEFKKILYSSLPSYVISNSIRSYNHDVFTMGERKLALSPFEDKRWLHLDGIHSLAYGHFCLEKKRKIEQLKESKKSRKRPHEEISL